MKNTDTLEFTSEYANLLLNEKEIANEKIQMKTEYKTKGVDVDALVKFLEQ